MPNPRSTPYFIRADEVAQPSTFLATWNLPFKKSFLQLALESFAESFRVDRDHLRFLNLMIAQALFNVGQHDLRFRISRTAAILLGRDEEDVELVFEHMREYYDKRSQLVHTGKFEQITGLDVWMLAYYVREAIKAIATSALDKDATLTPNKSLERTVERVGAHRARCGTVCAGRCGNAVARGRST